MFDPSTNDTFKDSSPPQVLCFDSSTSDAYNSSPPASIELRPSTYNTYVTSTLPSSLVGNDPYSTGASEDQRPPDDLQYRQRVTSRSWRRWCQAREGGRGAGGGCTVKGSWRWSWTKGRLVSHLAARTFSVLRSPADRLTSLQHDARRPSIHSHLPRRTPITLTRRPSTPLTGGRFVPSTYSGDESSQ